jgi:hypothetical protein
VNDRIEATARLLLDTIRELEIFMTGDQRISEADAARLLGFANPCSLKNARHEGRGPAAYRLNGRVSYRVDDLAQWLESGREDW